MRSTLKAALVIFALLNSNAILNAQTTAPKPGSNIKVILIDPHKSFTKGIATVAYQFNFSKKQGYPSSCWTPEPMQFGNTLACPIDLDSIGAPGRIVDIDFRCSPVNSKPCQHTVQCPGGGVCDKHLYRSNPTPAQMVNGKVRKATWYGWTDDGNDALLTVIIYVDPTP
jgi:hypothetical protein